MDFFLILLRDFSVTLGAILYLIAFGPTVVFRGLYPNFLGKSTTALQYLVFYDAILSTSAHSPLIKVTVALGFLASASYLLQLRAKHQERAIESYTTGPVS